MVDASIAVKWAVYEPGSAEAPQILEIDDDLGAPDIIFAEVANVLRKKVKGGAATPRQATDALDALKSAIGLVEPAAGLCRNALDLALRLDHSAYDCFYLAMASRDRQLVTADDAFVRKCRAEGHGDNVMTAAEMIAGRASQLRDDNGA